MAATNSGPELKTRLTSGYYWFSIYHYTDSMTFPLARHLDQLSTNQSSSVGQWFLRLSEVRL